MWKEIFYAGQVFCECFWLTRILLKPGLKKLNPTVCCHLHLRGAESFPSLRESLHWPVKVSVISPLEMHFFQPAEAVCEPRHRSKQEYGHLIRPVNPCYDWMLGNDIISHCENVQSSKWFSCPVRLKHYFFFYLVDFKNHNILAQQVAHWR